MKNLAEIPLAIAALLLPTVSVALPASARLFQQNYGYKVSCMLCHANGGGSAANGYGKAFLRAGANLAAFKKIEAADSDGDGTPNLKEILAKSNAGDKLSTPTSIGDWLAALGGVQIPQKQLEELFPGYTKFSAIEGSLNTKQLEFLKAKLGYDPVDDDKVPTFYFAEKDGKRDAVGQLISQQESGKGLTTGIAVATSGKILRVEVLGGSIAKDISPAPELLASYANKTVSDLPAKSSEAGFSRMLHSSIERSLYLIQSVFGGIGN
ncbi:MAG: hypothetical protein ABIR96_08720 [Bdellovibrionota bacterium]